MKKHSIFFLSFSLSLSFIRILYAAPIYISMDKDQLTMYQIQNGPIQLTALSQLAEHEKADLADLCHKISESNFCHLSDSPFSLPPMNDGIHETLAYTRFSMPDKYTLEAYYDSASSTDTPSLLFCMIPEMRLRDKTENHVENFKQQDFQWVDIENPYTYNPYFVPPPSRKRNNLHDLQYVDIESRSTYDPSFVSLPSKKRKESHLF